MIDASSYIIIISLLSELFILLMMLWWVVNNLKYTTAQFKLTNNELFLFDDKY